MTVQVGWFGEARDRPAPNRNCEEAVSLSGEWFGLTLGRGLYSRAWSGLGSSGFRCGVVISRSWRCKRVVRFYNQRGTAEQWIKEGKNAVKWTKLSCHDFADN